MSRFVITPRARLDLISIWEYTAKQASIETANRVLATIHDAILDLAELPGMGHVRPDVKNKSYRFWRVYNYLIAYRTDGGDLTIARVIHGARNFRFLFR